MHSQTTSIEIQGNQSPPPLSLSPAHYQHMEEEARQSKACVKKEFIIHTTSRPFTKGYWSLCIISVFISHNIEKTQWIERFLSYDSGTSPNLL